MNRFIYILLGGVLLLCLILIFYQKKKKESAADSRLNPSLSADSFSAAEKILRFIAYFEATPLKEDARRFLLTPSTFEIMVYHEALGRVLEKYEHHLDERVISTVLLHETYQEKIKPYLGGDEGFRQFLSFSGEIHLSERDSATPALCIPLSCDTEAKREAAIQEIEMQYQLAYQKPFPYKIFHPSDTP